MAVKNAGYTLAEAEGLRKGVAKKNAEIIAQHKKMFFDKATALGRKPEDTEKILEQIEAAGRYSFNKSHAIAYAYLAYVCAYLSANHPLYFFKNLLTMSADVDRADYLGECLMRKIPLMPPDINLSDKDVSIQEREVIKDGKLVKEKFIRLGMLSMKGIGDSYAQKIIEGRPYKTIDDCVKNLSKSMFSILYSANAFSSVSDASSFTTNMKVDEGKVLGIVLSGVVAEYQDAIDFLGAVPTYTMAGGGIGIIEVLDVKQWPDKNEETMAFVKAKDIFGPQLDPDLLMFASTWKKEQHPKKNQVYGMVLSRLPSGVLQIKALDTIEEIRGRVKVRQAAQASQNA